MKLRLRETGSKPSSLSLSLSEVLSQHNWLKGHMMSHAKNPREPKETRLFISRVQVNLVNTSECNLKLNVPGAERDKE